MRAKPTPKEERKFIIACDMDCVVADFIGSILPYAKIARPGTTIEDVIEYDLACVGLPKTVLYDILKNWEDTGGYRNMKTIEGAVAGINALEKTGHDVYFLTARDQYLRVGTDSLNWLIDNGFLFHGFQSGVLDKLPEVKRLEADLFIDDCPNEIERACEAGVDCIIYDQPWNQKVKESPYLKRGMDWEHIVGYIDDLWKLKNSKEVEPCELTAEKIVYLTD